MRGLLGTGVASGLLDAERSPTLDLLASRWGPCHPCLVFSAAPHGLGIPLGQGLSRGDGRCWW